MPGSQLKEKIRSQNKQTQMLRRVLFPVSGELRTWLQKFPVIVILPIISLTAIDWKP